MKRKHLKTLNRRANWLKERIKEVGTDYDADYDRAELSALLAVLKYFEYDTGYAIIEEEGGEDE